MLSQLRQAFLLGYGLWGTFGIFLGALSLFNLFVKAFNLGLSPVIDALLATYRWTFHAVLLDPIWSLLSYVPPLWLNDAVVVWVACSAISYRTLRAARGYAVGSSPPTAVGEIERRLFCLAAWKFSLVAGLASLFAWPLLWARYIYSEPLLFRVPGLAPPQTLSFEGYVTYRTVWLVQLISIMVLVALLLITSAGLPSS